MISCLTETRDPAATNTPVKLVLHLLFVTSYEPSIATVPHHQVTPGQRRRKYGFALSLRVERDPAGKTMVLYLSFRVSYRKLWVTAWRCFIVGVRIMIRVMASFHQYAFVIAEVKDLEPHDMPTADQVQSESS
jgi:hypothetical protein